MPRIFFSCFYLSSYNDGASPPIFTSIIGLVLRTLLNTTSSAAPQIPLCRRMLGLLLLRHWQFRRSSNWTNSLNLSSIPKCSFSLLFSLHPKFFKKFSLSSAFLPLSLSPSLVSRYTITSNDDVDHLDEMEIKQFICI